MHGFKVKVKSLKREDGRAQAQTSRGSLTDACKENPKVATILLVLTLVLLYRFGTGMMATEAEDTGPEVEKIGRDLADEASPLAAVSEEELDLPNDGVDKVDVKGYGEVDVHVFNRKGKAGTAYLIHGMSPKVVREWDDIALALSSQLDMQVYVPNFHSNAQTRPGKNGDEAAKTALKTIAKHYNFQSGSVIFGGKSWGTRAVADAVCGKEPVDFAKAVMLANPVNKDHLECLAEKHPDLFYLTTEDDFAAQTLPLYQEAFKGKSLQEFTAAEGGHSIVAEMIAPVVKFCKDQIAGERR